MEKENDMLITYLLLRLNSIEKILIDKKIFSKEEYEQELGDLTKKITESVLEKSKDLKKEG